MSMLFGNLHRVPATNSDEPEYWRVQLHTVAGTSFNWETLLLTDGDLGRLRARAAKNPTLWLADPPGEVGTECEEPSVLPDPPSAFDVETTHVPGPVLTPWQDLRRALIRFLGL